MSDTPAITPVEQCRVLLKAMGFMPLAVVRAANNKWDLAFSGPDRTTVLVRVSGGDDPCDQAELMTIAAQQTFQRVVLVAPNVRPSNTHGVRVCPAELLPDKHSLRHAVIS